MSKPRKNHDRCGGTEGRRSHHPDKLKADLASRLNRIEGQLRGVKRMIECDAYCDDVLNVMSSIQSALHGAALLLLENHVKSCVVDQIRDGDLEVIGELMKTLRRMKG